MIGVEHGHVRRIRIALALADSVRRVDEFLSLEVEPQRATVLGAIPRCLPMSPFDKLSSFVL